MSLEWAKEKLAFYEKQKEAMQKEAHATSPEGILSARRFNPLAKPPPLRATYTLAGTVIGTPGNLVAIASAPKTGKSAVVGAMITSTLSTDGTADLLGFASDNPKGLAVLHFDSEQSPDDHWHSVSKALKRANATEPPPWLYSYCLTGVDCSMCWDCVNEAVLAAKNECGGIHSVLIDGVADLVADVNDAAECNAFVAELHDLAITHDCPIIGVIHFNPGGDKTRGHLGSQFERKAETNLRLDRGDDGVTTIWSIKQRRAPIPQRDGPCFQWSNSAGMHVSVQNPSDANREAKAAANFESMLKDAIAVFAQGNKPVLAHGELVALVSAGFNLQKSGARRRIERWLECQIVRKDEAGSYSIAQ